MRVVMNAWFLDQPGTGSGQYLQGLLRTLPSVAPDVQSILVAPSNRFASSLPEVQAELWPLRGRLWRSHLGKVILEQIVFPHICRRCGADIAHVPYWGSPLRPTVPTVVTVHDVIPLLLPAYRGGLLVRLYTRLAAASARRAAWVVTDSLASMRDIVHHLRVPAERVRSVYLAPGEHLSPQESPDDVSVRQFYGLVPGLPSACDGRLEPIGTSRYILYLAGHDIRKNVDNLLVAFSIVTQSDNDVSLVIGGKLPDDASPPHVDPRPLVDQLRMQDRVRFIGWVEEDHKPALYRGAACAVFPSRYEGFGLPVLEALACGTPMISSNASSLPELLGDAGFALDPDDVEGLAGAMLACLVDGQFRADLRQRGPKQAARFSWTRTVQETVDVYREAASCAS